MTKDSEREVTPDTADIQVNPQQEVVVIGPAEPPREPDSPSAWDARVSAAPSGSSAPDRDPAPTGELGVVSAPAGGVRVLVPLADSSPQVQSSSSGVREGGELLLGTSGMSFLEPEAAVVGEAPVAGEAEPPPPEHLPTDTAGPQQF